MNAERPRAPHRAGAGPARILATGFAAAIAVGALLLALPLSTVDGNGLSAVDAYFTAASAVCVTGLTVINVGATLTPFGQTVVLLLIQIGGLGVMTVTTLFAYALRRRISLRDSLTVGEAFGAQGLTGVGRLIRGVVLLTLAIEGAGALLLAAIFSRTMPLGQAIWFGVFHSVSGFCNAGFDLFGDSLVRFAANVPVNLIMMTLIVAGGLGFAVVSELLDTRLGRVFARWRNGHGHNGHGRDAGNGVAEAGGSGHAPVEPEHTPRRRLSLHSRMVLAATGGLILAGTLLVLLLEWSNPATLGSLPPGGRVLAALFQSITPRTAGFNTLNTAALTQPTLLILMILMFIGASPGSTGGGIKTTTLVTMFASVRAALRRRDDIEVGSRRLPGEAALKAWVIAALALTLVVSVTIILLATEKAPLTDVMFEAFSALGTVGLSTGITAKLSVFGRIILPVLMYAGRLGPLTLVVALARRRQNVGDWRLPEERIIVG